MTVPCDPESSPEPPEEEPEIVLRLSDILPRVPPHLLKPGPHDAMARVRFSVEELAEKISRGRVSVPLDRLASACPDVFRESSAFPGEQEIPLPLQKLLEQVGLVAPRSPAPNGIPREQLAQARAEASRILESSKPRAGAPPAPAAPSAASAAPAPSPSLGIGKVLSSARHIFGRRWLPGDAEIPPTEKPAVLNPPLTELKSAPPAQEEEPVQTGPEPPAPPVPPGFISLRLLPIFRLLPAQALRPGKLPSEARRIVLPLSIIDPQLVTGHVEIPLEDFIKTLPKDLAGTVNPLPETNVWIPLDEIFQNLPTDHLFYMPALDPAPPAPAAARGEAPEQPKESPAAEAQPADEAPAVIEAPPAAEAKESTSPGDAPAAKEAPMAKGAPENKEAPPASAEATPADVPAQAIADKPASDPAPVEAVSPENPPAQEAAPVIEPASECPAAIQDPAPEAGAPAAQGTSPEAAASAAPVEPASPPTPESVPPAQEPGPAPIAAEAPEEYKASAPAPEATQPASDSATPVPDAAPAAPEATPPAPEAVPAGKEGDAVTPAIPSEAKPAESTPSPPVQPPAAAPSPARAPWMRGFQVPPPRLFSGSSIGPTETATQPAQGEPLPPPAATPEAKQTADFLAGQPGIFASAAFVEGAVFASEDFPRRPDLDALREFMGIFIESARESWRRLGWNRVLTMECEQFHLTAVVRDTHFIVALHHDRVLASVTYDALIAAADDLSKAAGKDPGEVNPEA